MKILSEKIEGPFVVDRDLAIHGMITVEARVRSGCTLHMHGMVTGDLIVEPGAIAIVHGMINGAVRNQGGFVELHGMVDEVVDSGGTTTILAPTARVRGRRP